MFRPAHRALTLMCPALAALLALTAMHGAWAGNVLDRVRRDNIVRCSATERPGVAMPRPDGGIEGLAVSLCRAVAIAVLGRNGRVAFALDDVKHIADVTFIDAPATNLGPIIPAPAIFTERLSVLVPVASRVHTPLDLAGETICLIIASPGQRALDAAVARTGIDIVRLPFEEDDEMRDAYAAGRCGAMVGTWTELAALRGPLGINRLMSRVLAEPLSLVPIVAATGKADAKWTELVFWVVRELVSDKTSSGEPAPALSRVPPGVRPSWRRDVNALLGDLSVSGREAGD